jgi:hypothetical protein
MQVLVVDDGGLAKVVVRALREAGEPDGIEPVRKGATVIVGRGMTLEIEGREYRIAGTEEQVPTAFGSLEFGMDLSEEVALRLKAWATRLRPEAPLTDMDAGYRRFEKRRRDGSYRRGRR